MSQWGKRDRINLSGITATANLNSRTVVVNSTNNLTGPFVVANVNVGDSLVIENVRYRVEAIPLANTITLDVAFTSSNSAVLTLGVQQSPKELTTYGWGNAAIGLWNSKRNVYGVDSLEAGVAGNKANGISHTGWVRYETYTTSAGSFRRKSEVLVAMSKNFNRDQAGALLTDSNDDAIINDA